MSITLTIAFAIAMTATLIANVLITMRVSRLEHEQQSDHFEIDQVKIHNLTTNKRLDDTIKTANANDLKLAKDLDSADKQIEDIIKRLEAITADIHRIDHDEKEIRSYYVNYRDPAIWTSEE